MPTKKKRTPIPADLVAEVLFAADRTCCVCNEPGKSIQIHHLDENPSNNEFANFAVLCLEHHNGTQLQGGFGRHLDAAQLRRYRADWQLRVEQRRKRADELAIQVMIGKKLGRSAAISHLADLLMALPDVRRLAVSESKDGWESGVTGAMLQSSYDYIYTLEAIASRLARCYPEGAFGVTDPYQYFSDYVATRFFWHRACLEPGGPGTGGTIVGVRATGSVIADLENAIESMVFALGEELPEFNITTWKCLWMSASPESESPSTR